jgi:Pectate lyase superfamily protein
VSSGGTTAPAAGTSESWTVASSSAFPAAANGSTPPTQFHVADINANSEIMAVTNVSGTTWTVTRGAESTTPVTHTAGFTVYQVATAGGMGSFPQYYNVRAYRATGNGTTDDTTAIQNAITAAITAGGGVAYIPAGTYKTTSTITANLNGASVAIYADPGAVIEYYGSGDCIRMYDSSSYTGWRGSDWRSGVYGFLSIDGANSSASAASAGLHIGDILGVGVYCSVRNFSQHAGSIGVHFDNNYTWTEQLQGRVHVAANGTNVMFDNSANTSGSATGSFDRAIVDIFAESNGVGDGVTVNNGAILLDSRIGIYGNFSTSTTQYAALKVTGNNTGNASTIQNSVLNIGVELDDTVHTAPYTIYQGTATGTCTITGCSGVLDFASANAFTASNFNLSNGNFAFLGPIFGDANLSPYGQYGVFSAAGGLYVTGSDGGIVVDSPGSSSYGAVTIGGAGDGSQYSNFVLADNLVNLTGHFWAFSHQAAHNFLIFNYNGAAYTNALNITEAGVITGLHNTLDGTSGATVTAGVASMNGGTDTSGTATASSPSFTSGTAKQCSTTQDVILYIAIQTAAALAVAIGPTSTPASTIMPSQSYALGLQTIRVPKGWYVKITGTIADLTITQVTC